MNNVNTMRAMSQHK